MPGEGPQVSEAEAAVLYWAIGSINFDDLRAGCISRSYYEQQTSAVTDLELFMNSLPDGDMHVLAGYPNLKSLSLHLQAIPQVVGLEGMRQLQRLSMTECGLTSMHGIECCTRLTFLDLSMNQIAEMDPNVLQHLSQLQTLWMNENLVTQIEGLAPLKKLTTLWLARNQISSIGDTLDANTTLTDLNLAATAIGSFKDIPHLARLRQLRTLAFSDLHYGESPVCALCNYQTYVLYHLQQLSRLDSVTIAEESRQLAEATYMKKKMYYNMRIKTLKRNTSNVIRKGMEARQAKASQVNLNLNVLIRQQKDVEREVHERDAVGTPSGAKATEEMAQLHRKLQVLSEGIEQKTRELALLDHTASDLKAAVCESSQSSISRLLVELETGGNIRLEDGKPSDVWYSSCVDLVNSRFLASEYAELGISGLRVTRVTRVHNRHLRNRFEERLEGMVNVADAGYKRSLEYLFFGEHPQLPGEIMRAMEEGFRPAAEYEEAYGDAAVPLSNSVALCDLARLQEALQGLKPAEKAGLSYGKPEPRLQQALSARLLITKVFLARCAQEKLPKGAAASPPLEQAAYEGFSSVYRLAGPEGKQRQWFVFDPALVLPEYYVELDYTLKHHSPEREPTAAQLQELGAGLGGPVHSESEAVDMSNLTRPLLRFVRQCKLASTADPYDELCTAALNMPPPLPHRPKVHRITEELLCSYAAARGVNLSQLVVWPLEVLNLHGNNIRKIECLEKLPKLRVLVLSFNEIHKIEGLEELRQLQRLELGFNLIKRIEGLKGLEALRGLELNNNLLYRLEDLTLLRKCLPNLSELNLRNNAVCEVKSYRAHAVRKLPSLALLDGLAVASHERAGAAESSAAITPTLIRAHAYTRRRFSYSLRPNPIAESNAGPLHATSLLSAAMAPSGARDGGGVARDPRDGEGGGAGLLGVNGGGGDAGASHAGGGVSADDDAWWEEVEELELDHQHLRKLHGLERLTALRRASFCNNELTRIEGLESCQLLEELSLEDNRLTKLEGVSSLLLLTKLDLGKNKIARIEGLESLVQLAQLSLEDNEIDSLAGLANLASLMEVYIGNNRLSSLKEVQQLKGLAKLIILDLSGNALCDASEYRSYTVFHLRRLKVLDGAGIESAEQAVAKERYAGRLTVDALVEKVGHNFWEHVRELDLSRSKIRELEGLQGAEFVNLRELNLDSNLLSAATDVPHLPALAVLRLNHNLIATPSAGRLSPPVGGGGGGGISGGGGAAAAAAGGTGGGGGGADTAGGPMQSGIGSLLSLEVLQLGYNQISDLPALRLHGLLQLKVLHLQGNELVRVDGLGSLLQLRELALDRNKIRQLDPLALRGLASLRELRLEENGLRSLDGLAPLPKLQTLCLGNNRILDIGELDKLGPPLGLPALLQITLSNNAVARKQLYRPSLLRRLPSLTLIDGREVGLEERDRAELIFSSELRPTPHPGYEQRSSSTKVPLKLTSMNFELMSGLPMPLGAQQASSSAAGGASGQLLGIGLPAAPHSAGSLNGHGGGDGGGGSGRGGTYFPMSAGHEDLLRPAREPHRPPRPAETAVPRGDPRAAPRRHSSGYVAPAPRDGPGRRPSPAPPPRHSH